MYMPGFVGTFQGLLVYSRVLLVYARVCWDMPGFVGICQGLLYMPEFVAIYARVCSYMPELSVGIFQGLLV